MLVSRRFFSEASSIFANNKTFILPTTFELERFISNAQPLETHLLQYFSSLKFNWHLSTLSQTELAPFTNLHELHLRLNEYIFPGLQFGGCDHFAYARKYTEEQLAAIPKVRALLTIRGLRKLVVTWEEAWILGPEEKRARRRERWGVNKGMVEKILKEGMTMPKDPPPPAERPQQSPESQYGGLPLSDTFQPSVAYSTTPTSSYATSSIELTNDESECEDFEPVLQPDGYYANPFSSSSNNHLLQPAAYTNREYDRFPVPFSQGTPSATTPYAAYPTAAFESGDSLTDKEVPMTEEDLVHLCVHRPGAVLRWMWEAKGAVSREGGQEGW